MHNVSVRAPLEGGQLDALRSGRGGVHGLEENLDSDLQILVDGVRLGVIRLKNTLSSLVVLTYEMIQHKIGRFYTDYSEYYVE